MGKKICIVSAFIPPDFTGSGKRAYNQGRQMVKDGYDVVILTTTISTAQQDQLRIITIDYPKKYKEKTYHSLLKKMFYILNTYLKMNKIIRSNKFDVIHCFSGKSSFGLSSIISGKLSGAVTIIETTLAGDDDPISIRNKIFGLYKMLIYNLADYIVNISPLLMDLSAKANLRGENLLICNFADNIKFCQADAELKNVVRDRLNLCQDDYILLYVGVVRLRKRVDLLVEVFREISEKIDNAFFVIAGPTEKGEDNKEYSLEIIRLIDKYNLHNRILITGEVNNVDEWMKAADIFVFASEQEGFGTVLVEAMSSGLPVITMNIAGITDYIITDGYNGIIVNDSKDFSSNIIRLHDDCELCNCISFNAVKTVSERFNKDLIMKQYYNLYDRS